MDSSSSTEENPTELVLSTNNQKVSLPIINGMAINALDIKNLLLPSNLNLAIPGYLSYDPGYKNTAAAKSRITFINGEKGELLYRGYAIEDLAQKSDFLEVAFLLIFGELPTQTQYDTWVSKVMGHTYVHSNLIEMLGAFRYDAHPMGMMVSALSALSTFFPRANPSLQGEAIYRDSKLRNKQIYRIIGKITTIAACCYRHRIGRPYTYPKDGMGYCENFLAMLDELNEKEYRPHPTLVRALNVLFILHADHELNCSTSAMRHLSSAGTDPFTAVSGAAAALYGPKHGGSNERVVRMLQNIGSAENIPAFLERVKRKEELLFGFGHRVYKNYDPRARIIKKLAYEVFELMGEDPLIHVATTLEKTALSDPYFIKRKLYPNIDFYSGLIYRSFGFPTDMFPVLFCIPRATGWLAHWVEQLDDPETKIWRPRQIYLGHKKRTFIPRSQRIPISNSYDSSKSGPVVSLSSFTSRFQARRKVSMRYSPNRGPSL